MLRSDRNLSGEKIRNFADDCFYDVPQVHTTQCCVFAEIRLLERITIIADDRRKYDCCKCYYTRAQWCILSSEKDYNS